MKRVVLIVIGLLTAFGTFFAMGQGKSGEEKMAQDIEVAENILSTLIRQQFGKKTFFPIEIHGAYTSGFGVTFRLPQNNGAFSIQLRSGENFDIMIPPPDMTAPAIAYSYSYNSDERSEEAERAADEAKKHGAVSERKAMDAEKRSLEAERRAVASERNQSTTRMKRYAGPENRDSLRAATDKRFLEVAKIFLADYGDILSQLKPDERILITNRSDGFDYAYKWGGEARRSLIAVEARRDDITQFRQGKTTRDQ